MTISHHPSDATLAAFAAATLDEGCAVVVSTHLATCPACRKAVRDFERLRGVALRDGEPVAMAPDALQRALAAISSEVPSPAAEPESIATQWPGPLSSYPLGTWRWIGPGVHWRRVGIPSTERTRVFMLKAAPGTRMPHHEHAGIEWTCVLQGAFRHQYGVYGAGDFDEADQSVEHLPVVEDSVECICLVALQGQIRLKSWVGRLIQPLVRI
jgi:putative transcriptional regulator